MRHRGILVDWMIEMHANFSFGPETLYLAVGMVDRFLFHKELLLKDVQLLGIASLYVTSKLEELHPLSCHLAVDWCNGEYTEQDVRIA